ncbi:MAG: hypothetical protein HOO96_28175 [Polyangiaceae bacterium]|nr:hypothetical protein [Polyangiaceae bacterium]
MSNERTDSPGEDGGGGSSVPRAAWWTERRVRAYELMKARHADLAELYAGAVDLRQAEPPIAGASFFISHAVRDICNRLPDIMTGEQAESRVNYEKLTGELVKSLRLPLEEIPSRVPVQFGLDELPATRLTELAEAHLSLPEKNLDRAARLFASDRQQQGEVLTLAKQWTSFREFFIKITHLGVKQRNVDFAELCTMFDRFETNLLARVLDFYSSIEDLDRVLKIQMSPSDAALAEVTSLLAHPQHVTYLFERLEDPGWVSILHKNKFFSHPPQARMDARGTLSFPSWAPLIYLARASSMNPEAVSMAAKAVLDAVAKQVDGQRNVSVVSGVLNVAIRLPVSQSRMIARSVLPLLESTAKIAPYVEDRVVDLIVHLAEPEQTEWLGLARWAFYPVVTERGSDTMDRAEVGSRISADCYRAGMDRLLAQARLRDSRSLLAFTADMLRVVDGATRRNATTSRGWRPRISDADWRDDVPNILVDSVRDALLGLADVVGMDAALKSIDRYDSPLFVRIALYVASVCAQVDPSLIKVLLLNDASFFSHELEVEYAHLLGRGYAVLSDAEKTTVVVWASSGPKPSTGRLQEPDTPAIADDLREWWMLRRLRPIADQLDGAALDAYRQATTRHAPVEDVRAVASVGEAWVGPTSPFSKEDLSALGIQELIAKLSAWTPRRGLMEDSAAGLGVTLGQVVANAPDKFADHQRELRTLAAVYVAAIVDGFRQATGTVGALRFNVEHVLMLAEWIVTQEDEEAVAVEWEEPTPGWSSARRNVSDLMVSLLRRSDLPTSQHRKIWTVIEALLVDPDPSEAREAGASWERAEDHGINTTRGRAIEATVRYALWTRKLRKGKGMYQSVRDALQNRFASEPSVAVRSIFGWWFGMMHYLDPSWARSVSEQIFLSSPETRKGVAPLRQRQGVGFS